MVGVDAAGAVDLDAWPTRSTTSVRVVSVMAVNNEVGTIQPLADVVALVRERAPERRAPHRRRAGRSSGSTCRPCVAGCDLVAVSAHKFGGPKGVGALVVRDGVAVEPLLIGGGQERDRRSGTHNVAGIVAMARRCGPRPPSAPGTVRA